MYDLIVIGGGPAGYVGAIRAAQDGMSVALIEKDQLGGTCLNRGCIPTKALLHYASAYAEAKKMSQYGVYASELSFDFDKMHQGKDDTVLTLQNGIAQLVKANKITLISGKASISDAHTVICNEQRLECKSILIATGSVPSIPPIAGKEKAKSSDDLLQNSLFYKRLGIVGGGVIGVEMASIYNALGAEVFIFEAMDRVLPMMDREISQSLAMIMKKRGINIFCSARVEGITGEAPLMLNYTCKDKSASIELDGILICTGRRPNTEGLFADGFDLEMNGRCIAVDENFQTSVNGIYAAGDINGIMPLAHAAEAQALAAVAHMQNKQSQIDPALVPSCVYTDPEIATVGLSTDEAKQRGIAIKTAKYIMGSNSKTIIEGKDRSFIKLVFDENTRVLLGAQLFCAHATDMIAELTTAIANKLTDEQLLRGLRPHPTFVEGITEAVEAVHGLSIHSLPSRR